MSTSLSNRRRGFRRHGMTNTRTHKSWESMLSRCHNKNDPSFHKYGGAGVSVCDTWLIFENFLADMGIRPEGKTLDRYPESNGNYEPGNCRWATPEDQQRNKGNTRRITFEGETRLLIDWSRDLKIPYDLLLRRANRGLEGVDLFAPSRSRKVSRFNGLGKEH